MTENLSPTAVDAVLSRTRHALEELRAPGKEQAEPLSGEGDALDGQVRATATSPGQIESLEMDPRVLRRGSDAVCDAMTAAVNAALEDLRTKATAEPGGIDPDRARTDLEQLQAESLETARTLFGAVHEAMARLDRR